MSDNARIDYLEGQNKTLTKQNNELYDAYRIHQKAAARLRALLIRAQRKLHSTELHAGHGYGTMAECLHPDCQAVVKEM